MVELIVTPVLTVAAILAATMIEEGRRRRFIHPPERGRTRNAVRKFLGRRELVYEQAAGWDPGDPYSYCRPGGVQYPSQVIREVKD
jgi:hypothetical protein